MGRKRLTPSELLRRVEADGFETIRVVFTDPHGVLRGKTITAAPLPGALESGIRVPSTLLLKDISHRTAFPVWQGEGAPFQGASDLLLTLLPDTFTPLPMSPHSALIECEVTGLDGAPVPFAPRTVLSNAISALAGHGYAATMGVEIEFQIYQVTDPRMGPRYATIPAAPPLVDNTTQGYQYLTETRYAEAEPLLDKLRRMAEAMGLPVRSVEIEMGPSQYEFTFAPADPIETARICTLFRMLAKEVCARDGLLASFMPKPGLPNAAANGWHIHQSLSTADGNAFRGQQDRIPDVAGHWVAGLLDHAPACALLTNPTVNSYKRFQPHQLAPTQAGWARDNRGAMIRTLIEDGPAARIENRAPDSSANPYFAPAAQVHAGLAGLQSRAALPPEMTDPYGTGGASLPAHLGEAIEAFAASETLRAAFGPDMSDWLVTLKRHEWARYLAHISDWEQAEYFATLWYSL